MRRSLLPRVAQLRTVTTALAIATSAAVAGSAAGTGPDPAPGAPAPVVAAQVVPVSYARSAAQTTVMVIRHGEKPHGSDKGFDAAGHEDDSSLTKTGWARARKLTSTFGSRAGLSRPAAIYAAQANDNGEGARTRETVAPLASTIGMAVDTRFGKGDEEALVRDVSSRRGPVLVSWSHKRISDIAAAFPNVTPKPPSAWPDSRYDMVWVFTKTAGGWHFSQVPEMALPGDKAGVIGG